MQQKVSIRFDRNAKAQMYLSDIPLKEGDLVIAESHVGQSYGRVEKVEDMGKVKKDLPKVIRKATKYDAKKNEQNFAKERKAIVEIRKMVGDLKLEMNVVSVEYSFDDTKLMVNFTSEGRVDFRELVKELAGRFHTRIELRQIGVRDKASMIGGIGICGRVLCCASYLKDFEKVSIKMAKNQDLALNPSKISGVCGRLLCCLEYENKYYSEMNMTMPKLSAKVKTPDGEGIVVDRNMLKKILYVKLSKDENANVRQFKIGDVTLIKKAKTT